MAYGLQIWDASGQLILDTSTRVGIVLGVVAIGNANGSHADPNLSLGTPFWTVQALDTAYNSRSPIITANSAGISWIWRTSGDAANPNCTLIYGVF